MRDVAIIGAGITPCKSRWVERTYYGLAQMAVKEVVADAGISVKDIDGVVYGIYNDIFEMSAIPEHPLQGIIGMANKPGMRITCGGATGSYTMLTAYTWVASGLYDVVLALGVEKATDCFDFESMTSTPEVIKTIGWSGDTFYERELGWTASDSYAEVVLAYMDEHPDDLQDEASARIAEILSDQVQNNPYAQRYNERVTAEMAMNSRYVVYPFKLLETCVYTEGAGAVIFAAADKAEAICKNAGVPPIWVTGVGAANEHNVAGRDDRHKVMNRILSDHLAAQSAYKMAGVTDPVKEIQVVEMHDAFIKQLQITMAEMGFTSLGRADDLVNEGIMEPGGPVLVNPSGGLTYGGHFVGGSNMFSCWSARKELINRDLERALVHGTGSTIAQYASVMVIERRS
ncbi:MAG: thiolase family protein [SAR202 cluster bacterium]|jgi:acetyl-CoA C-acetyltransferase|nr:thiolase family protein [SAR202 cluster bacterium]